MKNLLLLLLVLVMACQPNQSTSDTSDSAAKTATDTPASEVNTETEDKAVQFTKLAVPDTAYITAKSGLRVRNSGLPHGEGSN